MIQIPGFIVRLYKEFETAVSTVIEVNLEATFDSVPKTDSNKALLDHLHFMERCIQSHINRTRCLALAYLMQGEQKYAEVTFQRGLSVLKEYNEGLKGIAPTAGFNLLPESLPPSAEERLAVFSSPEQQTQ